ncbi:MAG: hypothetical protein ING73_15835 [Rhodocyclaceae bacterium]|nr:hypothetical protein [Rhodocyclaceae bacterium]
MGAWQGMRAAGGIADGSEQSPEGVVPDGCAEAEFFNNSEGVKSSVPRWGGRGFVRKDINMQPHRQGQTSG